jgi:hypothetical protein
MNINAEKLVEALTSDMHMMTQSARPEDRLVGQALAFVAAGVRAAADVHTNLPLGGSTDAERLAAVEQAIEKQQSQVFDLQQELALAEGQLEGLMRLRERIGLPKLSTRHTLRARVQKYLEKKPGAGTSEIAAGLCAPVTTVSMCLGRNKDIFERRPGEGWANKT